jgi:hypothetical protein
LPAAAAQHVVEAVDARRDPLGGGLVIQPHRRDGQHRDAFAADQEGVFVGAVLGAAVLDDAQPARRDLVHDAVVEQDHAIGHVLLEAVAGQRGLAALAGDDRRDAAILQPAQQAPQLGAQHGVVGQAGEQRLDGVEHHALRADAVDRVAQADEQAFEVVLAGLLDLVALDVDVVDRDFLLRLQLVEVDAQRTQVLGQFLAALLEHHEHARLAVLQRAVHEEFGRHHRLARAGGAAQERGPSAWQATRGDLVQALDAGGGLGQGRRLGGSSLRGFRGACHVVRSFGPLQLDVRKRDPDGTAVRWPCKPGRAGQVVLHGDEFGKWHARQSRRPLSSRNAARIGLRQFRPCDCRVCGNAPRRLARLRNALPFRPTFPSTHRSPPCPKNNAPARTPRSRRRTPPRRSPRDPTARRPR